MNHSELSGMTVNERLFAKGLMAEWQAAVRARSREKMIEIMRSVEIEPPENTVDAVLTDPGKYGF